MSGFFIYVNNERMNMKTATKTATNDIEKKDTLTR